MWGVSDSKTPQRVAGTAQNVPTDVARSLQEGRQGRGEKRILVTNISFLPVPTRVTYTRQLFFAIFLVSFDIVRRPGLLNLIHGIDRNRGLD